MKYIYGGFLIGVLCVEEILKLNYDILSIVALLGVLCLFIIKERFIDNFYSSSGFYIIVLILSLYRKEFVVLLGIPILDFLYHKRYPLAVMALVPALWICIQGRDYDYIFYILSAGLFGFIMGEKDTNERNHMLVIDEERRLRYKLEQTQNELIKSRMEVEHFAEIRERNRIAHEIHDNVGHNIAGVIFQIEAAIRIMNKDREKLESILKLCSQKLAEALELTRNTVHNIKVDRKVGLEAIEKIIEDFRFCCVSFEHTGDFNRASAFNMNIIEANVMECLTNAAKHSGAKEIEIKIDIGRKFIRFYYRDDGVGCMDIHDSLGLNGMRERVRNAGGTISVDGSNGFLIVCTLPVSNMKSGEEEVL